MIQRNLDCVQASRPAQSLPGLCAELIAIGRMQTEVLQVLRQVLAEGSILKLVQYGIACKSVTSEYQNRQAIW